MILPVIPVSDVDLHLAKLLARRIVKLGGMESRRVVVAASRNASWDIQPIVDILRPAFAEVNYFTLPTENELGWPESATHMFYSVVEHLEHIKNDQPWYFLEADNTPLRAGWLAEFDREYEKAGKPYMGFVHSTRYKDLRTGESFYRGRHMVGTGIYPADFYQRCKSVHYMTKLPFDICIEEEVVPECHHTELIAHRWNTTRYRLENGQITMDDIDPQYGYAAPVPSEASIVHGCKDDSLFKLLDQMELPA